MSRKFDFYCFELPDPLDKKEIYDLFFEMRTGNDEAKEKLVLHNLRLVFYIIEKKFNNTGYEVEELVSVGNIGLMKAINTFDPTKGKSFPTYATTCIINEILMFLRKQKNNCRLVSLEQPIFTHDKGKDTLYADLIPSDVDIIGEYEKKQISNIINECLTKLSDIERECIVRYFGLYNQKRICQGELAEKLNHTQPYVSKLISKAINKIKAELYLMGIINDIKDLAVINLLDNLESAFTIYQLLVPYTKEEIDNVLSSLTEHEKYLIELRYGNDLDNPVKSMFFTEDHKKTFYCVVIQKIRKLLSINRSNNKTQRTIVMVKKIKTFE